MSNVLRAFQTDLLSNLSERDVQRISGVHLSTPRVLVADDDDAFLALVERSLSRAGYTLQLARDGRHALEALERFAPHVLITDIGMPGTDGIELARAARRIDPDLQVVLMTASPDVHTATTAVELGAFRYLSKPFKKDDLLHVIERAMEECGRASQRRGALGLLRCYEDEQRKSVELRTTFSEVLGSLWMAYQPIVRAIDEEPAAFEALLRSRDQRLPNPGAVIDSAERLGAIHELGRTVRARAAAPFAADPGGSVLFVNLHPHDILDEDLYSPDSPLSKIAYRVVLEITERTTLDAIPDLRERVTRLRELGFRMAVDDLGVGFSAISTIAIVEPEVVKLDMSLVRDVHLSRTKAHIVRHLVAMTHDQDGLVVAEGIETEDEKKALVDLGCDLLQGYLIARPAPWNRPAPYLL